MPSLFRSASGFAAVTHACIASRHLPRIAGALLLVAPLAAWANTTAVPSFVPAAIPIGGSSQLTITLSNDATSGPVTFTAGGSLLLPANLSFSGAPATDCAGLTVGASGGALTFSGAGTVPAATGTPGSCTITAAVTSTAVNNYDITLPAGFFSSSDGTNPPGNALSATLAVSAPQPVTITNSATRGAATAIGSQSVMDSFYSPYALDFAANTYTRLRFLFTNPNAFALTNASFAFPSFNPINVIPNSLVAGSLNTSSTGVTTGAGTVVGCGGTLSVASYTVTPPNTISAYPAPSLTGATIPAGGTCEVSFLVRYDRVVMSGTNAVANNGGTITSTFGFPAGALTDDQGVTNNTTSITQNYGYGGGMYTMYGGGQPTSGYNGQSTVVQIGLQGSGVTFAQTPSGNGVLWHVDDGIEPNLSAPINSSTGCTALTSANWNPATRMLSMPGATPAATNCYYNVPFVASYTGPSAYTDAQICPLPDGPDGTANNADDAYVTTPGGMQLKVALTSNSAINNTAGCVSYRAVAALVPNADAVQIGFAMLDYTGAPIVGPWINSSDGYVQLTLTAPAGVSNYSLTTNTQTNPYYFKNVDSSLSYVPQASTTCGASATVTAPVNATYFSVSGVNLGVGQSCTVTVPVLYFSGTSTLQFSILTCDALGTIGGSEVCSTGISPTLSVTAATAVNYWRYTQNFIPAVADVSTAAAQGTIYRFVATKLAGMEPVENASATVNLTAASGADFGLQATEIVTNTCGATIGGQTSGAFPSPLSSVAISNISTPDSDAQGPHAYNTSAGYDPAAFQSSTCVIELKVMPTATPLAPGAETANAINANYLYSNNGGNLQVGSRNITTLPTYTLLAGPFQPPTVSKTFVPGVLSAGEVAQLQVTIDNSAGTTIDLTGAALTDTYPAGLVNASPANATLSALSGTCAGTLTATASGLTLSNANIPSGSKCLLTANVLTTDGNGVTNTIEAGGFTNDEGQSNASLTSASLVLNASIGPVLQFDTDSIAYDPNNAAHNVATLTLSIVNSYAAPATGIALPFTLPSGMALNGALAVTGSCTASESGTATVNVGGAIAASGTCVITIPVKFNNFGDYTVSVASGALTATVNSTPESNASDALATFTALEPATVTISQTVTGSPAAAPATGYQVALVCTNSGSFLNLGVSTGSPTSQAVQANDSCTVTETNIPAAPAGYLWGAGSIVINPSGSFATSAGATQPVAITIALNAQLQTINITGVLNPGTVGGTPPSATLNCTPTTGTACTLTTTAGTAPAGYTLGAITYSGITGIDTSTGAFTVPAGGGTITVTQALTGDAQNITLPNGATNVFSPATVTGGTLPTFALTCNPAATGTPPNLQAPTGADCTVAVTAATAPAGYDLDTTSAAAVQGTTVSGSGVTRAGTGFTFTVPNAAVPLSATTLLKALDQPITVTGVAFAPPLGGTPPTITLDCGAATVGGVYPSYQVPTGAVCTAQISGGAAPSGYTMGAVTFSGAGINPATGQFTVAAGGMADLSASIALTALTAGGPAAIPALDARALIALALLLLGMAGLGWRRMR